MTKRKKPDNNPLEMPFEEAIQRVQPPYVCQQRRDVRRLPAGGQGIHPSGVLT